MEVIHDQDLSKSNKDEIEIRLEDIIQFLKNNFKRALLVGIVCSVIGIFYAYSKPDVFEVEVTIMPEYQSRGQGGLGAASAFIGLGLDNAGSADAIRPDLYPNVLQSVPFAISSLEKKVYSKKLNATVTLKEFINKSSTVSFIDKFFTLFTTQNDDTQEKTNPREYIGPIQLTKFQDALVKSLLGSVSSTYDKKTSVLTINSTTSDPFVTAAIAQLSLNYLTDYITAYRTDKARRRVVFLSNQVQDAKQKYESAEYVLSSYRDRNRSLFLNTAKLEEQRLQANYLLEQSVYNDLARQLEQAKIKVVEDTPTFKTLQPPIVPLRKSGPRRTMIVMGSLLAGVIVGYSISLGLKLTKG